MARGQDTRGVLSRVVDRARFAAASLVVPTSGPGAKAANTQREK